MFLSKVYQCASLHLCPACTFSYLTEALHELHHECKVFNPTRLLRHSVGHKWHVICYHKAYLDNSPEQSHSESTSFYYQTTHLIMATHFEHASTLSNPWGYKSHREIEVWMIKLRFLTFKNMLLFSSRENHRPHLRSIKYFMVPRASSVVCLFEKAIKKSSKY